MSAVAERVAALVERYGLDDRAVAGITALLELLASDPHAPTTVRDRGRAVDEHIADSLVALELQPVRTASTIADIGSGAGYPGLPLAIARPDAEFVLVESNGRKCEFIRREAAAASLANVGVAHTRAEAFHAGVGRFDLVTARAVAPLAVLAEYAAPLLAIGGALVAWRGRRDHQVELDAAVAADVLGLEVSEPVQVQPFPTAEHRYLHLLSKVRETPDRFPRRPGMALKRPLGAESAGPSDRRRR